MPKVLVSDKLSEESVKIFKDKNIDVDYLPDIGKDKEKLAEIIKSYDGLAIRSATKVTDKILSNAKNLKVIGRAGIGVDNVDIEINGSEVPIMDGSSSQFINLIENSGIEKLSEKRKFLKIKDHVEIIDGDKKCSLSPSNDMKFFASIDFSDKVIGKQEASISLENFNFKDNVSEARTFGFMRDVEALRMSGLGLGGSLDNCIIIDNNEVINSEGLRFENEFVIHKLLDAVGDIFTSGYRIQGEYKGYLCGHHMNNLLLKELFDNEDSFELIELDDGVYSENQKTLLTA